MLRNYLAFALVAITLLLSGCGSNPMKVADDQHLALMNNNESQIVFMRSTFVGSAISASLYDVTSGEPEFIGIINNGTKVAYATKPGKRVFMVVSEAADYLEANLEGGKTYYSIVTPRMGAWVARFSMWPIRNGSSGDYSTKSKDFESWLSGTKLVTNSEKSEAWFEKNEKSIQAKHEKYWPAWQEKSQDDLARRTLNADDGV